MYQAFLYTADIFSTADAINKAKEFAENVGSLDWLHDENIELNKPNQSMIAELETAKKNLAQAEQALETERQKQKDALCEVQDRLDKRLDESVAIDDHLLSKFHFKNSHSLPFSLSHFEFITELCFCLLWRVTAMSYQRITGLTGFWRLGNS